MAVNNWLAVLYPPRDIVERLMAFDPEASTRVCRISGVDLEYAKSNPLSFDERHDLKYSLEARGIPLSVAPAIFMCAVPGCTNDRHMFISGKQANYCLEHLRLQNGEAHARAKAVDKIICCASECERPRHVWSTGKKSNYCIECLRASDKKYHARKRARNAVAVCNKDGCTRKRSLQATKNRPYCPKHLAEVARCSKEK